MLLASSYDRSRLFKAEDLQQEIKLRIKNATEEPIGTGVQKEPKLCLWFTNDPRGLIVNKTNNRVLRGAFGDAVDGWTGKVIALFQTMDQFAGKPCKALRVRIPPPKQSSLNAGQAAAQLLQPQQGLAQPQQPTSVQPQLAAQLPQPPQLSLEDDLEDEIDF